MKAQEVVEQFLILVAQGKLEQAQEFIIEESQGMEQTISEQLCIVSILCLSDARYLIAMHSLEAALEIAPLEDMKKKIRENLAVVYNDCANFSFRTDRFDAEEFFEKSLEMNPQYVAGHFSYAINEILRQYFEDKPTTAAEFNNSAWGDVVHQWLQPLFLFF